MGGVAYLRHVGEFGKKANRSPDSWGWHIPYWYDFVGSGPLPDNSVKAECRFMVKYRPGRSTPDGITARLRPGEPPTLGLLCNGPTIFIRLDLGQELRFGLVWFEPPEHLELLDGLSIQVGRS